MAGAPFNQSALLSARKFAGDIKRLLSTKLESAKAGTVKLDPVDQEIWKLCNSITEGHDYDRQDKAE